MTEAWEAVNAFILRKGLSREVDIGYGIVSGGLSADRDADVTYHAAIEMPVGIAPVDADELSRAKLAGGAFYRRRFHGELADIADEFSSMIKVLGEEPHVRVDAERPLVTVMLKIADLRRPVLVRSNLLVPACGTESRRSASAAA